MFGYFSFCFARCLRVLVILRASRLISFLTCFRDGLEVVIDFLGVGIVNAVLFHWKDDGDDFYVCEVGGKYFSETVDKAFDVGDAFSGDVKCPVVVSMEEVAAVGGDAEFFHLILHSSFCNHVYMGFWEGFTVAFEEDKVAIEVEFFIIKDGGVPPDGFSVFKAFNDPPDFLPGKSTSFCDDIDAFFGVVA
jgi:hypothetical protein